MRNAKSPPRITPAIAAGTTLTDATVRAPPYVVEWIATKNPTNKPTMICTKKKAARIHRARRARRGTRDGCVAAATTAMIDHSVTATRQPRESLGGRHQKFLATRRIANLARRDEGSSWPTQDCVHATAAGSLVTVPAPVMPTLSVTDVKLR